MLLNTGITKFTSITQNNYVYEHTAEGPTPEVSLNIRSPYRRQKRDLSIIRLSFRRPYTRIEIPAVNIITFLPTTLTISYFFTFLRLYRLFPIFLPSCDHIDYFLPFYLLAIISTISYLLTFLRSYRLLNNPYSLSQSKPRWIYHAQAW
jgi:hypothetical protein